MPSDDEYIAMLKKDVGDIYGEVEEGSVRLAAKYRIVGKETFLKLFALMRLKNADRCKMQHARRQAWNNLENKWVERWIREEKTRSGSDVKQALDTKISDFKETIMDMDNGPATLFHAETFNVYGGCFFGPTYCNMCAVLGVTADRILSPTEINHKLQGEHQDHFQSIMNNIDKPQRPTVREEQKENGKSHSIISLTINRFR